MEKTGILIIAILIFLLFIFLFWRITSGHAEKEYGAKMWKHWPAQLSYWQAAILYSTGATAIVMVILKWADLF